ncbi:MAG: Hpt domain-containing protein, partial [Methylobacter sp.]
FAVLPVIALTAGVTKEERERCMASGMNDFIAKPINPPRLLRTLAQWLRPDQAAAAEPLPAEPEPGAGLSGVALPGFDLQNLWAMIGNNEALALSLLQTFRDSMQGVPDEVAAFVAVGDPVRAKAQVHKLKGAAGTVGAVRLYAAATEVEAELNEHLSAAALARFKEAFDQTMAVIAALPSPAERAPGADIDQAARQQVADDLDRRLTNNDFIPDALLDSLKPHLTVEQYDGFARFRKQVNDLHYDEARKILRQLTELSNTQESE